MFDTWKTLDPVCGMPWFVLMNSPDTRVKEKEDSTTLLCPQPLHLTHLPRVTIPVSRCPMLLLKRRDDTDTGSSISSAFHPDDNHHRPHGECKAAAESDTRT